MTRSHDVDFYCDYVSPYTYLALSGAVTFAADHGVRWRLRPVVYGALLTATGLVGPAEVSIKRRYTFRDIARSARLMGIPLVGPPAHPFRSLEALRTTCLFGDDDKVVDLAVALGRACWGEGRDLTDVAVIAEVVAGVGLDADDLGTRIAAPEVKTALHESTEGALAAGVFGVPTFRYGGELFWGNDRRDQLAACLEGRLELQAGESAMENRPRGVDRRGAPVRSGGSDR